MGKKNYGKSVKTRLLNLMNETGYKYMVSSGKILHAMNGLEARPTVDVDFMADRISRDRDFLASVFQEILGIVCHEDGVSFDAGSIKIEPITVEKKYFGTRFYFTAHLADRTRRL